MSELPLFSLSARDDAGRYGTSPGHVQSRSRGLSAGREVGAPSALLCMNSESTPTCGNDSRGNRVDVSQVALREWTRSAFDKRSETVNCQSATDMFSPMRKIRPKIASEFFERSWSVGGSAHKQSTVIYNSRSRGSSCSRRRSSAQVRAVRCVSAIFPSQIPSMNPTSHR